MPEPDLLSSLQPPTLQSVMDPLDTLGQVGVGLAGVGREHNPFLVQAQDQFRQQVELMRLRQNVDRLRLEKSRLLLSVAKDLPDDNPDAVRKKLEIYNQSGIISFSPQEMETATGQAKAKQRLAMLPQAISGIVGGVQDSDLEMLFPNITKTLDLSKLRSLPRDTLTSLGGPDLQKTLANSVKASIEAKSAKLQSEREDRIARGIGTPTDFLLSGAKTPEDIGSKLISQATASGIPAPVEYQPFLKAYALEQQLKGLSGNDLLAMRSAMGDPLAIQALKIAQDAKSRMVGELKQPFMNRQGDTAPSEMPVKEAVQQGFFEVTSREEGIVLELPTSMAMLSNLMTTAKQIRDNNGFRKSSGVRGAAEIVGIKSSRLLGDPAKLGGLLRQFEAQKSELISLYRRLGEKGNIAAKIMVPQLEGVMPEAGFPAVMRMFKFMETQLKASVLQSRIPGFIDRIPALPTLLFPADPRYRTLQDRGLTDQQIEAKGDIIVVK